MEHNPYAAPQEEILDARVEEPRLALVASGQKLVIYSILADFGMILLQALIGTGAALFGVVATVMSIVGLIRLGKGLGMSRVSRMLLVVATLIPLVNLVTLLVLNSIATKQLRNAGYRVGLLGASK